MIVNRHKYFRWTKRTALLSFAYVVAFPAFVGYWAFVTDVSFPSPLGPLFPRYGLAVAAAAADCGALGTRRVRLMIVDGADWCNRASWNSGGRGREIRLLSFKGWVNGLYITTELKWRYFLKMRRLMVLTE